MKNNKNLKNDNEAGTSAKEDGTVEVNEQQKPGTDNPDFFNFKSLDANRYATKKTIAQGMLDIALLTANASQLKYILQVGNKHEFYTLMLTLISISILLQIIVGVLFVVIGGLNINKRRDQTAATVLNDVILVFVFVISLVNVIISGFGIEHSNHPLKLLEREKSFDP